MIETKKKIAIIGGGIAGLAAAHLLSGSIGDGHQVTLFESNNRLGGALWTDRENGFLIERSADMFVTEPSSAVELCRAVGIADQLISPSQTNRFSSIIRNGNLIRIPQGFSLLAPNKIIPVLRSPLLSLSGKLRFLREWFTPVNANLPDESLKSFAVRHYGREVFQRIIQPLVAGIYSADAGELSTQATLNRFVEMEERYGSLIKAARSQNRARKSEQQSSGARYGLFVAPQRGMQSLVDAIVADTRNVDFQMGTSVASVVGNDTAWVVKTDSFEHTFDAVLIATSAKTAATMLDSRYESLISILSDVPLGSMIVITIACDDSSFINGPPAGFGFVVPEIESRKIIACSFSSNKFVGRAPQRKFLMRCFIGGPAIDQSLEKSDDQLATLVTNELRDLIGYQSKSSDDVRVLRWQRCMPQYLVGHLEKMKQLDKEIDRFAGLQLAGSSYSGVGIPACIENGQTAARRILEQIEQQKPAKTI